MTGSCHVTSSKSEAMLHDCFASADWNMFRDSANSVNELITSTTGFIRKCIVDVVPTLKVLCFPNQKPRINTEFKDRAIAHRATAHRATAHRATAHRAIAATPRLWLRAETSTRSPVTKSAEPSNNQKGNTL